MAEVLITLGIIGIVAAMTLPAIIQKKQEKATVTALKKFYSVLSQAYLFAESENGTPDVWGFSKDDSTLLLTNMTKYMQVLKVCKTGEICHPVKTILWRNGNKISNTIFNPVDKRRSAAVLNDGMIIGVFVQSPDCSVVYGKNNKHLTSICGEFMVDINGAKNPNQYGVDIFIFNVTKYGIIPSGAQVFTNAQDFEPNAGINLRNYRFETGCLQATSYGWGCTGWVLQNENLDYLHCSDLSWTGKSKCK